MWLFEPFLPGAFSIGPFAYFAVRVLWELCEHLMLPRTTCWQRKWATWLRTNNSFASRSWSFCVHQNVRENPWTILADLATEFAVLSLVPVLDLLVLDQCSASGFPELSPVVEFRRVYLPSWNKKLPSREQERLWARCDPYCRVLSFHFLKIQMSSPSALHRVGWRERGVRAMHCAFWRGGGGPKSALYQEPHLSPFRVHHRSPGVLAISPLAFGLRGALLELTHIACWAAGRSKGPHGDRATHMAYSGGPHGYLEGAHSTRLCFPTRRSVARRMNS